MKIGGIILQQERLWTKNFLNLCICSFFIFMSFYALLTALPFFVLDELNLASGKIGFVISIYLFAAVIIRPFAGRWLDTAGRKKVLSVSLVLLLAASVAYLFVDSYNLLVLIRFIQGIGFGMATTATGAIAADLVPETRRGEGIGYYGLFMSMAMVVGPYLGLTVIQQLSFLALFIVCILFAGGSLVLGISISLPRHTYVKPAEKQRLSLSRIFEKTAIPISVTAIFLAFAYSSLLSYVSLYATDIGLESIAGIFFIVFAIVIIVSRPFTGKWFDMYGENRIVYPALLLFFAGMILLSFTGNAFLYLLSAAVIGLGYGAIIPSFQTISIQKAAPNRRGMATATYFIFFDTGIGIGAYLNGIFSAEIGYRNMFLVCAAFVLVTLLSYFMLHGRTSQAESSA